MDRGKVQFWCVLDDTSIIQVIQHPEYVNETENHSCECNLSVPFFLTFYDMLKLPLPLVMVGNTYDKLRQHKFYSNPRSHMTIYVIKPSTRH